MILPMPGIEPGPPGWKPGILAIRPRGIDIWWSRKTRFYIFILICYFFFAKSSIVFSHFICFSIVLCSGTVQINSNKVVLTMFANSSILWKCHFRGYESCYRTETWKKKFSLVVCKTFTIQKLGCYAWWNYFASKHFKNCHNFGIHRIPWTFFSLFISC